VTNCLNFGNPERPEIMAQFVGCLEGMGEACRALDFPIVSGNVSLYNESKATGGGSAILPTPAIGGVGILDDCSKMATIGFKAEGDALILIGHSASAVGQSLWLREIHGREDGIPPSVDLAIERRNGEFVRDLIVAGSINAVHDCSDGGALVAIAEMGLASGLGAEITLPQVPNPAAVLFGEDQARYLVTSSAPEAVIEAAKNAGVFVAQVGIVGGAALSGPGLSASLADLREASDSFFRDWMEG